MGPVVRRGDDVYRTAGEWTPAVHRLLRHCRAAGLTGVPEPKGITGDGREVLSFVRGDVPAYPMPKWIWSPEALRSSAQLLREFHRASQTCHRTGPWRSPVRAPAEVVCHNDFAPYNLVYTDGMATGVIDFDYASPGPRLWDLAYLAYRIVPLTTDDVGDGFGPAERMQRLADLLVAYGTSYSHANVFDTVRDRLVALAEFSERMAETLGNPELRKHADLYRRDAARIARSDASDSGPPGVM
jgi:Ser/Thr protein kinase RdoA (MazF antagonist)